MDIDEGGLAEVISLFIDINQLGVRVNRFDIVRTMYENNKLLADVFKLIAIKQKRGRDNFYKMVDGDFTKILKYLQNIQVSEGADKAERESRQQERVDKMWERLLEVVLFMRTRKHRTLAQILKAFIGDTVDMARINGTEMSTLRSLFKFLASVYSAASIKKSKLATDQPHFYTMVTSISALGLIAKYGRQDLKRRLIELAAVVDGKKAAPTGKKEALGKYLSLSSKQTTHPGRREERQALFAELLEAL